MMLLLVVKLSCPSNLSAAPTAGTSPFGLCAVNEKIAKGELVLVPGATETVCPLMVTTTGDVLVAGAVRVNVAGWKVMLLPALRVVVPVTPAWGPDPTKVMPTVPDITVMVTLPHLTVNEVLAGTERIDAPPQTLMLAGVSPPVEPEVISMPTLGDTSAKVSWQGIDGHWSPLERIVPDVVPPSGMSLKQLLNPTTPQSMLSGMPSPSESAVMLTLSVKVAVRVTPPPTACIVITVEELGALGEAVKVTVALHVGLQGLLENADAVTPLGSGVTILNVTALATPDVSVAVAVSTPPGLPVVMFKVDGEAARLKSNCA